MDNLSAKQIKLWKSVMLQRPVGMENYLCRAQIWKLSQSNMAENAFQTLLLGH